MNNCDLFDLDKTIAKPMFNDIEVLWEVVRDIKVSIFNIIDMLDSNNYYSLENNIWIHKNTTVDNNVKIIGPCIIDEGAFIKTGAYIRENVIIGKNCIIGSSVEIKNSILFDNVKTSHFNYIGDSIIGENSNMGGGVITANKRLDNKNVISYNDGNCEIKLRKAGAIIGSNVEIGCNSVVYPKTIIGKNTVVYPLVGVRGVIDEDCIIKNETKVLIKKRKYNY